MKRLVVFLGIIAAAAALPADDAIELRNQYVPDDSEVVVDSSLKADGSARYNPDSHNVYHLFTRLNPTVSQPMLVGNTGLLGLTNYNPIRRTIVLLHGWNSGSTGDLNTVLVPAFLQAEDVNIIVVDWTGGSNHINYLNAVENTRIGGEGVARFINWLNNVTGAVPAHYHIIGHSLGAHMAGIIGRNMNGRPAYITALEPALPGFISNDHKFRADDGVYTEVIHTNAGQLGYASNLGHVDFYPNGGNNMPGCNSSACDHARSYHYLGETLTSGGFTGRRCATYVGAMTGNCALWGTLPMGGLVPKNGQSGIYYLQTNDQSPFSKS